MAAAQAGSASCRSLNARSTILIIAWQPRIALQLFVASLKDHKDAWQRYMKLTNLAGMATYTVAGRKRRNESPLYQGSLTPPARWRTGSSSIR